MMEGIEAFTSDHQLTSTSPSPDAQSIINSNAFDAGNDSSFFASASNTVFPAVSNENGHDNEDDNAQYDQPSTYGPSTEDPSHNPYPYVSDSELRRLILKPWTPESRQQFHQKFNSSNPLYKNKLRLSPHAEARIRHFVLNPTSPIDHRYDSDARMKLRSKTFTLHPFNASGRLYRMDSGSGIPLRRHVNNDEVWDMITSEHMRSCHKGRDKMLNLIKERFIGYTLDELMFVLYECRVCQRARSHGTGAGAKDAAIDFSNRMKAALRTVHPEIVDMYNPGGQGTIPVTASAASQITGKETRVIDLETEDEPVQNSRGIASLVGAATIDRQVRQQTAPQQWTGQSAFSGSRRNRFSPNDYGLVEYDYPDWYG